MPDACDQRSAAEDGRRRERVINTGVATLATFGVLPPTAALACPACFGASTDLVLRTYYLTAAGLTLLPLLMVGIFAWWLYRRFNATAPPQQSEGCEPP